MPSRIIQASITSGANVDKVGGTYVTFGSILSDTGAVSGNYKVTSASLYLSYHRTYSTYAYLNVIYGGSGGAIVARTNNISSDSNSHSATYPLTDLSINLLTMGASAISLGVVATNSTSGNKINVRDSYTLTLTINYEEESSGGDSGGGSTGGGSANDPTYTNGVLAPTEVKLSSTIAAPGAKVTLSWSGTYVYAPPNCNNIITNYWVYRATADPDDFPRSYEKIWEARPFQIYDPLDTSG